MTRSTSPHDSLPVCPKKPISKLTIAGQFTSEHAKLFSILAILVVGPLGALLVMDMFAGEDSPARITHNRYSDDSPVLFLLDSKDNPHIFWYGWRPPRHRRLFHATYSHSGKLWQIEECPTLQRYRSGIREFTGVFDDEGNIHLIYAHKTDPNRFIADGLEYLVRYHNGSWSTSQKIFDLNSSRHLRIFQLEIDPITKEKTLFLGFDEAAGFAVKRLFADSTNRWELCGQTQLATESEHLIGFNQINNEEIRIQYLSVVENEFDPEKTAAERLICSYHTFNALELIRNQTFPLSGQTRYYCEFQSPHIGLLESVQEKYEQEGGLHEHSKISFYIGQTAIEWKQIPINMEELHLKFLHGFENALCQMMGPNDYVFLLEMIKEPEKAQGLYLIRISTDGTAAEVISQEWLILEKYDWSNEGPLTALDSKGRLHITWEKIEGNGDPDIYSEIYYDYQDSGWDKLDWAVLG